MIKIWIASCHAMLAVTMMDTEKKYQSLDKRFMPLPFAKEKGDFGRIVAVATSKFLLFPL